MAFWKVGTLLIQIACLVLLVLGRPKKVEHNQESRNIWKVHNVKTFDFGPGFLDQFKSNGQLASVRYRVYPETNQRFRFGFEFKQKLWVGVQILQDGSNEQLLRLTMVRLDNLTEKPNDNRHFQQDTHDLLWREYVGWPVDVEVKLTSHGHQAISVPANPNHDVMQCDFIGHGFKAVERREMEIPHDIWQVSGNYVGKYIAVLDKAMSLMEIMNPHWKHHRTTVDLMEKTIEQLEGDRRAADAFAGLQPIAYKVDLYRLVMLYHYGGVYADGRLVPVVSFDEFLPTHGGLIPHDPDYMGIYNGFLALPKGSPLARKGIEQIILNVKNKFYGFNNLEPTGPRMLLKVFNEQLTRDEQTSLNREFRLTNYPCRFVEDLKSKEIMVIVYNAEYRRRFTGRDKCSYYVLHRMRAVYFERQCDKTKGLTM